MPPAQGIQRDDLTPNVIILVALALKSATQKSIAGLKNTRKSMQSRIAASVQPCLAALFIARALALQGRSISCSALGRTCGATFNRSLWGPWQSVYAASAKQAALRTDARDIASDFV